MGSSIGKSSRGPTPMPTPTLGPTPHPPGARPTSPGRHERFLTARPAALPTLLPRDNKQNNKEKRIGMSGSVDSSQDLFVANLPTFVNSAKTETTQNGSGVIMNTATTTNNITGTINNGTTGSGNDNGNGQRTTQSEGNSTARVISSEAQQPRQPRNGSIPFEASSPLSSVHSVSSDEKQEQTPNFFPGLRSRRHSHPRQQQLQYYQGQQQQQQQQQQQTSRYNFSPTNSFNHNIEDIRMPSKSGGSDAQSNTDSVTNVSRMSNIRSTHNLMGSTDNSKTLQNAKAVLRKHMQSSLASSVHSIGHSSVPSLAYCTRGESDNPNLRTNANPFIVPGSYGGNKSSSARNGGTGGPLYRGRSPKTLGPTLTPSASRSNNNNFINSSRQRDSNCPLLELIDTSENYMGGDENTNDSRGQRTNRQSRRVACSVDRNPFSIHGSPLKVIYKKDSESADRLCRSEERMPRRRASGAISGPGTAFVPSITSSTTGGIETNNNNNNSNKIINSNRGNTTKTTSTTSGSTTLPAFSNNNNNNNNNNILSTSEKGVAARTAGWTAIGAEVGIGSKDWYARLREQCDLEESEETAAMAAANSSNININSITSNTNRETGISVPPTISIISSSINNNTNNNSNNNSNNNINSNNISNNNRSDGGNHSNNNSINSALQVG